MNHLGIQAEISSAIEGLPLDKLNQLFDKAQNDIENYRVNLTKDQVKTIVELFNSELFVLSYQAAKHFTKVFQELEASPDGLEMTILSFRIVQQIIMESKFKTPAEAKLISEVLDSINAVNSDVFELETTIQLLAVQIERLKTEESTGLEFTQEDNETVSKLEVRPNAILEAAKGDEKAVIVED